MKRLIKIAFAILLSVLLCSCKGNNHKRIVSEIPIKTELLGLKLGDKVKEATLKRALTKATNKEYYVQSETNGKAHILRAIPFKQYGDGILYGSMSWHYIDIQTNVDDQIVQICLVSSYESVERAEMHYDKAVNILSMKYGEGNVMNDNTLTFWTDESNSVGTYFEESSTIRGEDRSFCFLYYVNIELADAAEQENVPDV